MKGFGLRAAADLPKYALPMPVVEEGTDLVCCRDTFIYEYVGDVVSQPSFIKRMRQYAEEGIRHFYFMMLQKDEVRHHSFIGSSRNEPCLFRSSLMPLSAGASVDLLTTAAIRIAMSRNGLLATTSAWASSRTALSRRTRS